MPLRIKCPTGHTLIVPDDRAGRTLQCPRCDQPVLVPEPEADVAGKALLGVLAERSVASASGVEGVGSLWRNTTIHDGKRSPATDSRPRDVVKPKSRVLPVAPPPVPEPLPPAPAPVVEVAVCPPPPVEPKVEIPAEPLPPEPVEPPPPPAPAPEVAEVAEPPLAEPDHHEPDYHEHGHHEPEAPPLADVPAPPAIFVPQVKENIPAALHDDAARTLAVYWLAAALVATALFSVAPAVWDVVEFLQIAESAFVARWALGLFFFGVVQLAYAVYLFQLPDWATVWVVTLFSLFTAAIYAGVLGLVLLSPPDGFLVGPQGLQLADKLAGGKAALWCVCMVSVSTILAFFAGKLSTRWRQAELMLRGAGF